MNTTPFTSIFDFIKKTPTLKLVYIDLFCGAGGTSTGVHKATDVQGNQVAMVIACVNHDAEAIASHAANHPHTLHYVEDIRHLNLVELTELVQQIRQRFPHLRVCLWASLECTNFSNAKGGGSRDADSRSLADHMPRYIQALNPDYFQVENVREFMSWGPLRIRSVKTYADRSDLAIKYNAKAGRDEYVMVPESRTKGIDYVRWLQHIESMGYTFSHRLLNSADYGAYTSRLRYFAIFSKPGLPVAWPTPTHAKKPKVTNIFGGPLKKWMPVRHVLRLDIKGESIFTRKKKPVVKTYERIYAGLLKHGLGDDGAFLAKYFSGRPEGKVIGVDGPAGAVKTIDNHSLVQTKPFIVKALGNNEHTGINNGKSIDDPSITVSCQVRQSLVTPVPFVMTYYSGSHQNRVKSLDDSCLTVTTENRHALVTPVSKEFIMQSNGGNPKAKSYSIEQPSRVITGGDNQSLVQTEFLIKYHNNETGGHSIEKPCGAITTKETIALVTSEKAFVLGQTSTAQLKDIEQPCGTLLTDCNNRLLTLSPFVLDNKFNNEGKSVEEPANSLLTGNHQYLITPHHGGNSHSVEQPCPVIVARQDKAPTSMVTLTTEGSAHWEIQPDDCEILIKIRQLMKAAGIADILMRMLLVEELLQIQGFPKEYILKGTDTNKKKFIGNAVEVNVCAAWTGALACA